MTSKESVKEFNRSLVELYYCFLKKYGLFRNLYTCKSRLIPTRAVAERTGWALSVSAYSNSHTYLLLSDDYADKRRSYVLSQLWRGYVLDNLDRLKFTSDNHRRSTIFEVKHDLQSNGTRNNKEVRDILHKYDIRVRESD